MLDHLRGCQRDLDLLMGRRHPQISRAGQVRAAFTRPGREMRHRVIGFLAPGQMRPRRPWLLAGLRSPRPRGCPRRGGVRPGRSSADGGIDELPLFGEAGRSSRSTLAARSATCPANRVFSAASAAITRACTAITASRAASTGIPGTGHHDQDTHEAIKPTR
jgi:hypothetical protein